MYGFLALASPYGHGLSSGMMGQGALTQTSLHPKVDMVTAFLGSAHTSCHTHYGYLQWAGLFYEGAGRGREEPRLFMLQELGFSVTTNDPSHSPNSIRRLICEYLVTKKKKSF